MQPICDKGLIQVCDVAKRLEGWSLAVFVRVCGGHMRGERGEQASDAGHTGVHNTRHNWGYSLFFI